MNVFFFIMSALFLVLNASSVRAEKILEGPAPQQLLQNAAESSFRIILNQSGRVSIEPGAVFTEGESKDLTLPRLVSKPDTVRIPSWLEEESWRGTVTIALSVREDGTVGETFIMTSSGNQKLDRLAEETIHSWQFEPAIKNGKPVYECIQIPITFESNG